MCHRLDMQSPGVSVPQINYRLALKNTINTGIVKDFLDYGRVSIGRNGLFSQPFFSSLELQY